MNEFSITSFNSQLSHIVFLKRTCGTDKANTIISSINSIFNFFYLLLPQPPMQKMNLIQKQ